MDTISREKRSENMSRIKSSNTKPELYIRNILWRNGYRYRLKNSIYGRPDIWLRKYRTAIFVHGCFWHRHAGCKYAYTPKSNIQFWQAKFDANTKRDADVSKTLLSSGVKILIIWECTIKQMMTDKDQCDSVIIRMNSFIADAEQHYLEL
ncbi:MAG: very short patch repair endonuclease [Bacillota bacterium]|nr:very short patch repair endonuclease [Bacillota bacterium]